jgi:DNA polymerase eta
LEVFKAHCDKVEKASIDESFLDLTSYAKTELLKRYPELNISPPNGDLSIHLPLPPHFSMPDELGVLVPSENEEEQMDWDDIIMFLVAEKIKQVREEVETKLGYICSAGISRNKMLAKLAAGTNKPNKQVSFFLSHL